MRVTAVPPLRAIVKDDPIPVGLTENPGCNLLRCFDHGNARRRLPDRSGRGLSAEQERWTLPCHEGEQVLLRMGVEILP